MNNIELRDLLLKRLKLKPISMKNTGDCDVKLKNINSLRRIRQLAIELEEQIKPKFSNATEVRKTCDGSHHWLDLWSSNDLLTFRVYPKTKKK